MESHRGSCIVSSADVSVKVQKGCIMTVRTGTYIVPTHRWYIERTVWLIAGVVLLSSSTLALLANPLWILGVTATGLVSINVSLTGFCPVGNVLQLLGFTPMLGSTAGGSKFYL